MKFEEALNLVGLAEGKYSNNPLDKGGETICGLARKKNPDLKIWEMIDTWKERGTTSADALDKLAKNDPVFMGLVRATYRGRYWNPCKCDELPELWKYPVFSCSVNCGHKTAIQLLQKALGIKADGIYGGVTTMAVRLCNKNEILDKFYELWSIYYDRIVEKYPSQKVFLNGWKNRIKNVKKDNF